MTRERFIKKWLGNNDFNYCEEHKDLMREDLDSVNEFAQQQVKKCDLADVGKRYTQEDLDMAYDSGFNEGIANAM